MSSTFLEIRQRRNFTWFKCIFLQNFLIFVFPGLEQAKPCRQFDTERRLHLVSYDDTVSRVHQKSHRKFLNFTIFSATLPIFLSLKTFFGLLRRLKKKLTKLWYSRSQIMCQHQRTAFNFYLHKITIFIKR